MELPYHFVDLDKAQLAHRRKLLDNYGQFAQISALIIPVLSFQVFFAARFIIRKIRNNNFQLSRKARQSPRVATFTKPNTGLLATGWSRLRWALNEDVAEGWGSSLEWMIAGLWTLWLLLLVIKDTGDGW